MNNQYCRRASSRFRGKPGFTLVELLVVMGITSILMGLLLVTIEAVRHRAYRIRCASNLRQIGLAIEMYANANKGAYPRTAYDPAAPVVSGTNAAAEDPFRDGGPLANDVTAAIFLLVRSGLVPKIVNCPYTDVAVFEPDKAEPSRRSNFTDYRKNLGYSYANPYPTQSAAAAGYKLNSHLPPGFAVMADLNPGPTRWNSRNHEDTGQNVLYADGHVAWSSTPECGLNGDNIYRTKRGDVVASPVDAGDSILLPTE